MKKIHLRFFSRVVGDPFSKGTEYLSDESLESELIYLKIMEYRTLIDRGCRAKFYLFKKMKCKRNLNSGFL